MLLALRSLFERPGISASGNLTLRVAALVANALETFSGTGSETFQKPALSAAAKETFSGVAAELFKVALLSGIGKETFSATAALALHVAALASSGTITVSVPAITGTGTFAVGAPALKGLWEWFGAAYPWQELARPEDVRITGRGSIRIRHPRLSGRAEQSAFTFDELIALNGLIDDDELAALLAA